MIPFLQAHQTFPPVQAARQDMGGLLAIGADLSPARLLDAYCRGIFPWGTYEGHPLWYCPDPRMVLFPGDIRITRSLRKTLRQGRYQICLDNDFTGVIERCAATPRPGQDGTWISLEMQAAYRRLHALGWAHSVETWIDGELVGGLYGLAIGGMFYGESMFSHRSDASKIAFAHLARYLTQEGFGMIDCQMHTDHLASLGAREIALNDFLAHVQTLTAAARSARPWAKDAASFDWS